MQLLTSTFVRARFIFTAFWRPLAVPEDICCWQYFILSACYLIYIRVLRICVPIRCQFGWETLVMYSHWSVRRCLQTILVKPLALETDGDGTIWSLPLRKQLLLWENAKEKAISFSFTWDRRRWYYWSLEIVSFKLSVSPSLPPDRASRFVWPLPCWRGNISRIV